MSKKEQAAAADAAKNAEAAKAEADAKKAKADAEKQAKKEAADKLKAEKDAEKAKKDAEKAEKARLAKEAKDKKEAEKADKLKAAEDAKKAKEAKKQPEQNGVRRPGPDGACGKAWSLFDSMSEAKGSPVAIGDALEAAEKQGLNSGNVRTEYARWKKFFGLAGRIERTAKPAAQAAEGAQAAS